jgi:subtilisin family serine protease
MSIAIFFSAFAHAVDFRTHIAVIDTGVNVHWKNMNYLCDDDSHLDLTGQGFEDKFGHGTNIAGILARSMNKKNQCLQIIKWVHDVEGLNRFNKMDITESNLLMTKAVNQAIKFKAKYVNMSYGGPYGLPGEYKGILQLLKDGAIVATAAGNDSANLDITCNYYPACYNIIHKNYHVVGNKGSESSNFGKRVTNWADGNKIEAWGVTQTGTSQATAVYLGGLIK